MTTVANRYGDSNMDGTRKNPSETVATWRKRLRAQGMQQITVWVPKEQADNLKASAKRLSEGGELQTERDELELAVGNIADLLNGADLDRLTKLPEVTDNARVATDADIDGLRQALPAPIDNAAVAAAVVEALKDKLAEKDRLIELLEKIAAEPKRERSLLWGLITTKS